MIVGVKPEQVPAASDHSLIKLPLTFSSMPIRGERLILHNLALDVGSRHGRRALFTLPGLAISSNPLTDRRQAVALLAESLLLWQRFRASRA